MNRTSRLRGPHRVPWSIAPWLIGYVCSSMRCPARHIWTKRLCEGCLPFQVHVIDVNTRQSGVYEVKPTTDTTLNHRYEAGFGRVYNISVTTATQRSNEKWIQYQTSRLSPPRDVRVSLSQSNHAVVFWTTHTGNRVTPNRK